MLGLEKDNNSMNKNSYTSNDINEASIVRVAQTVTITIFAAIIVGK